MMQILQGVAVRQGLFIGKAKVSHPKSYNVTHKYISDTQVAEEQTHFEVALHHVEEDILSYLNSSVIDEADKDIIRTHMLILQDPEIFAIVINLIKDKLFSAAQAVYTAYEGIVTQFQDLENDYFSQRVADYKDIANRLMAVLLGEATEELVDSAEDIAYFIHEITPSIVTTYGKLGIKAYCSEKGSYNSHCSILSRALSITSLVAIPALLTLVKDGDNVIIDGFEGVLTINPDQHTLAHYRNLQKQHTLKQIELIKIRNLSSDTLAGRRIDIRANIELPQELAAIADLGSAGIGLFRTEFLYLNHDKLPSEDEQTSIYSNILSKLSPQPVTIRTFDLGGDKLSHLLHVGKEDNPNLGKRGIRFSLHHIELFKTQIRAILRASNFGDVKIMFPMIMGTEDFLAAKAIVMECMQQLLREGIPFQTEIPLGVMIEIPSAAIGSAKLAEVADFFSIGTNDLVQYTLAVDRNNDTVSQYYIQHHPAVLSLIQLTIDSAKKAGISVSVCGEMASIPEYIPLFCGMGITELSVNPNQFYLIKTIIRRCDERLDSIVHNFDFNTSLQAVETLIYQDLKAYYNI